MTDLNLAGESHAHSLIAAGKIDKSSPWSFDASDGNALLGSKGEDWDTYSKFHLGIDRSAAEKTKGRFKYPYGKGGKVYRAGVIAAKQRAAQQSDGAVEKAAASLLDAIDKDRKSLARPGLDFNFSRFEYKFTEGDGKPAGTFEGYGSVFNNEDDKGDLIKPGAFTGVLADHKNAGTMPKMLLNHGGLASFFAAPAPEDLLPVGKWNGMSEDTRGLECKGQLINLDTESGKRLYGAMKEGQLDSLSMAYLVGRHVRGTKDNEPRRIIETIKELPEVGPVTFPANTSARIHSLSSSGIGTIREFEAFLRDAGGFSRAQAAAIAERGYKALDPRDEDDDIIRQAIAGGLAPLADAFRR